jgi:hypothetical protein
VTDWIRKLEQTKHLLDIGALTQDEFNQEKARLLGTDEASIDIEEGRDEVISFRRRKLIALGLVIAFFVIGHFIWNFAFVADDSADSAFDIPAVAGATVEDPEELAETVAAEQADLSSSLTFSDPMNCTASGTLQKVFVKLDSAMDSQMKNQTVRLDELADALNVSVAQTKDGDGVLDQTADIKFDGEVIWNWLRLTRIKTHLVAPPDTDSSYSRLLFFREEPETVRRALASIGLHAPLEPAYAELNDGESVCGGAMSIKPVQGGSALVCGWGC